MSKFSPEETEARNAAIRAMRQGGATYKEIGMAYSLSKDRAWQICHGKAHQRLRNDAKHRYWKSVQDRVAEAYGRGATLQAVADHFGLSVPVVRRILKDAKVPIRRRGFHAH